MARTSRPLTEAERKTLDAILIQQRAIFDEALAQFGFSLMDLAMPDWRLVIEEPDEGQPAPVQPRPINPRPLASASLQYSESH